MKKGFTLIELLIVISIIGVLAVVVLTSLNSSRAKAREVVVYKKAQELQRAIETFALFEGRYPTPGDQNTVAGHPLAVSCDSHGGIAAVNNWADFVADMGDYLPEYFQNTTGPYPFCFQYSLVPTDLGECVPPPNAEYSIIFGAYDEGVPGVPTLIDGMGNTRMCIYSL